jgi:outer membrane protein assembly factor BamB
MDSKLQNDDDDDKLTFQNLMPEKPANVFQKNIIRIQDNWPPHWNKRYLFVLLPALIGLLIFFLVFESMHASTQPNGATDVLQSSSTIGQPLPYANVIYIVVTQATSNTGKLEALNARTGTLVWSYSHQNVMRINLFGDILYVQTDTNLVALNANSRAPLWENHTFRDMTNAQIDQGILFTASTNDIVTALNISTGAPLWETEQPSEFWRVDDGVFYTIPNPVLGLRALNAHNGQQLWQKPNIQYQDMTIDGGNVYLQSNLNQNIQAFDGRSGKLHWQFNTHEKGFTLSTQNGSLLLSNAKKTQVEVLNGQTGKLLWQHQGTLTYPTNKNPNQIAISSLQNNEIDIVRTNDGTTLYHIPHVNIPLNNSPNIEQLFSIANGIAFFIYFTQQYSVQYTNPQIVAVRISDGAPIWNSQTFNNIPSLQNDAIDIVINHNSLLSLRTGDGRTLWKHTFNTASS